MYPPEYLPEEFEKKMQDPSLQQRIRQDVIDGRMAGEKNTPLQLSIAGA
jgi:HEAT repeat protein